MLGALRQGVHLCLQGRHQPSQHKGGGGEEARKELRRQNAAQLGSRVQKHSARLPPQAAGGLRSDGFAAQWQGQGACLVGLEDRGEVGGAAPALKALVCSARLRRLRVLVSWFTLMASPASSHAALCPSSSISSHAASTRRAASTALGGTLSTSASPRRESDADAEPRPPAASPPGPPSAGTHSGPAHQWPWRRARPWRHTDLRGELGSALLEAPFSVPREDEQALGPFPKLAR